jgi:calpain-7
MVIQNRIDELKLKVRQSCDDKLDARSSSSSSSSNNANLPDGYTPDEIEVLLWSSRIASGVFQPWIDEEIRAYDYSPDEPWEDPDGNLKLSEEQENRILRWARPCEIKSMRRLSGITVMKTITPDTIKQCCVSDCSFIAGLCILAELERRSNRRLIASLIYPQDPKTGMPIYNEKGLYIVKLWFNGVERRVMVDDKFPVDKDGNLLCSHTVIKDNDNNNDGCLELWVPILEKAYMKLCGGYDFPGSNSGVDLFSLTGWIPERIYLADDPENVKDHETTAGRAWERLLKAYEDGDCLATVSTSESLSEEEAETMGLFTGHAYAVLKIFMSSNGTKLLQLKNPWASKVIFLTIFCHSYF